MWRIFFEAVFFVEPATGNILIDLLLPSVLSFVFYRPVYALVGGMYKEGFINGSEIGSIIHWFLRCLLIYLFINIFNFLIINWKLILWMIIIIIISLVVIIIPRKYRY